MDAGPALLDPGAARVAVVTGASRGACKGSALALGETCLTVYSRAIVE